MAADNTPVGLMSNEDFIQNVGSSLHSYQSTSLTLYFANKDGDKLVKETVNNVRYNSNISMERLVIEQLLKGPSSSGAYATIPANTKILSVSTRDQICYVNFDQELMNMKSNVKPEILIYSIVNSIVESGMAGQVQVSINGESNINFGGAAFLPRPAQPANSTAAASKTANFFAAFRIFLRLPVQARCLVNNLCRAGPFFQYSTARRRMPAGRDKKLQKLRRSSQTEKPPPGWAAAFENEMRNWITSARSWRRLLPASSASPRPRPSEPAPSAWPRGSRRASWLPSGKRRSAP